MLSLLPVTTAIAVVLAHLSTMIFAANGPTGIYYLGECNDPPQCFCLD